jgi:hypothetical protein
MADYTFTPSQEDLDRIKWYQQVSTEKKLEWLENMRCFMVEVWNNNPDVQKSRKILQKKGK